MIVRRAAPTQKRSLIIVLAKVAEADRTDLGSLLTNGYFSNAAYAAGRSKRRNPTFTTRRAGVYNAISGTIAEYNEEGEFV